LARLFFYTLLLAGLGVAYLFLMPESERPWDHALARVRWSAAAEDTRGRVRIAVAERSGNLVRWRKESDLRVWIEPLYGVGRAQMADAAVRYAFSQWQQVVPLEVVFVNDADAANVSVFWIEQHEGSLVGLTEIFYDERTGITGGAVEIAMRAADNQELGRDGLRAAALHEIGHLLGFAHTDQASSIMYPYLTRTRSLDESDLRMAKLHYDMPIGRFRFD
jgi:predicted Zn-dependent protease